MDPSHTKPYDNVMEMVGWTPLLRLARVADGVRTPLYGKCDFMNPGASVKDRIGLAIVEAAEADGSLKPGGVLVEATSGNTGMALAMAAAIRGYRCIFTMPDKMSQEKVKLLRAFGAEVVIVPTAVPPDHPDHYLNKAKSITEETAGAVLADQFYNSANPDSHYATTGPELWEQTGGRITHFFAGAGTGGTITGTARFLKEKNPEVKIIGVDPVGSVIKEFFHSGKMIEGDPYKVEGLGNDKIPGNLDLSLVDDYVTVSDREAFSMTRRLCREEGLFVGGSSGLLVHAALDYAKALDDPDACLVAILPDWGEHYLTKVYDDEWMRSNGFLERTQRSARDVMARKPQDAPDLLTVKPSTPIRLALSSMGAHDVSQLPVVMGGECVGSVREGELQSQVIEDPDILDHPVEEVMEAPYPVVDSYIDATELRRLLTRKNGAVLVREDGELGGIVTRFDVVRDLSGVT